MKVWHIVPKQELLISLDADHTVCVEEICVSPAEHAWQVRTQSDRAVADMTLLRRKVCSRLDLTGKVDVVHQVMAIHHGGDLPLAAAGDDEGLRHSARGLLRQPVRRRRRAV